LSFKINFIIANPVININIKTTILTYLSISGNLNSKESK